ncbi:olfactory receptor 14J1-like [Ciconia boyciana]|uniref:olfactory receptor 14J1-like n=1 Tax=Ciconia boyciana TaxID=52775 RepID=UPI003B9EB319
MALGVMFKGTVARVVFSSILLVTRRDLSTGQILWVNNWLRSWYQQQAFSFNDQMKLISRKNKVLLTGNTVNIAALFLDCISKGVSQGLTECSRNSEVSNIEEHSPAGFYLLTVMAYDRYVAICKPLEYATLVGSRACVHMAAAAWGSGFLNSLLHTANTFSLPLCQGNALDQFFCEIPQILKLSCSASYIREVGLLVITASFGFGCFVFIVVSYVQIFRAVLRIPSEQAWHKAFSTCFPHLAVVSLFLSTSFFAYLKLPSISSPSLDLVLSFLYSVVPPAVNPLIYSMRNQELKDALKKLKKLCSCCFQLQGV